MSALRSGLLRGDDGRSLPAVLVALAVGLLLITPLLSGGSTSMLATRAADQALLQQFSLDAGIEYGIWKLRYDAAFRALVDSVPLTPRTVNPPMTLNGYTPNVTATALSTSGWDQSPTDTPASIRAGGALTYLNFGGTNYLFAFRGSAQTFWRYNLTTLVWQQMANFGVAVANGAALTSDGSGYIYGVRGTQNRFRRYTPNAGTGTWANMANTPANVGPGGSLAYANGYVYALRGNNTDDFWRYAPPPGNTWATGGSDPPDPPGNVGAGGALVHIGGNTFFALQGGGQTAFWKYVVGWGSWQAMDPTPNGLGVGDGGALVYPGGDYIYAFRGGDTPDFWRYNIPGNVWESIDTTPNGATVNVGGALAYPGGDYVYALRGDDSDDHWRYRTAPPQYDIVAQSGARTTTTRIEISGTTVTVLFWDIQ